MSRNTDEDDANEDQDHKEDSKEDEKEDLSSSSIVVEARRTYGSTEEERLILQNVFKRAIIYSLVSYSVS